jgi:hypothetical protein
VSERARRWHFQFPDEEDRREHRALQAAARFLRHHGELFPTGAAPTDPTQLAVLAVETADLFLGTGSRSGPVVEPEIEAVRVALAARGTGTTGRPATAGP